jgi:hypothetical protein
LRRVGLLRAGIGADEGGCLVAGLRARRRAEVDVVLVSPGGGARDSRNQRAAASVSCLSQRV